ncbi:thiamine diphosphokinase [Bacillus sp. JJ634]
MNICIMAGGPSQYWPNLHMYKQTANLWIGVDRGVLALLEQGITPHLSVGDFDSVTKDELQMMQAQLPEVSLFPSEKDETDLELALNWAIRQKPKNIYIFGATGGRIDHFLGNIQLLQQETVLQCLDETDIYIIDEKNSVTIKKPGTYNIQYDSKKKYFSLLSVTKEVTGITLTGFKYPLHQARLTRGSTLCISNELISEYGNVSFEKGIIMMVRSND